MRRTLLPWLLGALACGGATPAPVDGAPPGDGAVDDGGPGPDAPPDDGGAAALAELIPRARFDELFVHRGTPPCRGAFYTYDAFLAAAARFPAFAATGTDAERRREVAAFLANISHETTGGWATAPDGPYAWGLCWVTEGGTVAPAQLPDYCVASTEWPCAPGKKYFGRGPIQLSYNYNYGQAGVALGAPLLAQPELLEADPTLAFTTALWFWMTPQSPKPSCHAVMTGGFTPSPADLAAGRQPGFGLTVNIINGGLECGRPTPPQVADRLGFYQRYVAILGTTAGDHLDCAGMTPY